MFEEKREAVTAIEPVLLFGRIQGRLSIADPSAARTDEYVHDCLFRSNEGGPRPRHRDIAGFADRRGKMFY